MAHLSGPADRHLVLEPTGYQFATADDHWDANWLHVRIHARDTRREWSALDPAFLTWELRDLVAWLSGLAEGEPDLAREFGGIEPCLEFEAEGCGDATRLRARFRLEFLPPNRAWWDTDEEACLDFRPGAAGLQRFAGELEEELRQFPVRP